MLLHVLNMHYLISSSEQSCGVSMVFIPIFRKIKLQLREVNLPKIRSWQRQDLNQQR